jgi:MFS transporter, DHA2 family, methylenomycin A resistance protein
MTTTRIRDQEQARQARTATLVAASLGFAVIQLDVFVVNVAVHQIGAALGGGTSGLQWVVGVYTLLFAALILTAGTLADRFGTRRMYSIGFIVFIAASLACGLAPSILILVIFRGVQGVGAALLGACSLALLNHAFHDPRERSRAVGLWAAGASTALAAGPVVGGLLIAGVGWRAIFFINLPIGAAGLWLTRRYTSETEPAGRHVDLPGQLIAVVTLAALAGGLIEGGTVGFTNPLVAAALALAAVGLCGFTRVEARAAQPMLPLGLFRRTAFAAPVWLGLAVNIAFYGLIFLFSLFFQQVQGDSALHAGLAFLPLSGAVLAANLITGPLASVIGVRGAILVGLAAMAAGCAGLLFVRTSTTFAEIVAQQILLGGGIGLLVPPMTNALMGSVDRSRSGLASGTLNTTRQTGSVLGVAIFGSLVAHGHFITGVRIALAVSIALTGIGMLLATAIRPPRRANPAQADQLRKTIVPTAPCRHQASSRSAAWRRPRRSGRPHRGAHSNARQLRA